MKTIALGEVAYIDRNTIDAESIEDETLYVGLEHITSDGNFEGVSSVSNGELNSTKFKFNEGHILYGKLRPYLKKIALPSFQGICSTDILPIKPKANIDKRFLFYCLRQPSMIELATAQSTGANLPRLSPSRLLEFPIPLPPLAEQKRIARILDVAAAVQAQRRATLTHLDTLLQSTFLHLFGDPVTNPMHWPIKPVIESCDCIVPGRDKPKSFTGDIPWITTDDLIPLGITLESKKGLGLNLDEIKAVRARVIPKHSVLLTCVGDLGVISVAGRDMVVNQQLHSFQCSNQMNPRFLAFSLPFQKAYMYQMATSTTLPYMNKSVCNSIPTIMPPIELQEKFATLVGNIEKAKLSQTCNLVHLDTLFQSLQQRAFRGELSPSP